MDALVLPGDHLPRQVLMAGDEAAMSCERVGGGGGAYEGVGGGRGAFAVSLGSSHSLALVGAAEFVTYPAMGSNATGLVKDWWPCLRDAVEPESESGDESVGDVGADDAPEEAAGGARGREAGEARGGGASGEEQTVASVGEQTVSVGKHRWTLDQLSQVAGADLSPQV